MLRRPVVTGERIVCDVDHGIACDGCGRRHRQLRRARGEVLAVDRRHRWAWILVDGEVHPRSIAIRDLRAEARKEGLCRSN